MRPNLQPSIFVAVLNSRRKLRHHHHEQRECVGVTSAHALTNCTSASEPDGERTQSSHKSRELPHVCSTTTKLAKEQRVWVFAACSRAHARTHKSTSGCEVSLAHKLAACSTAAATHTHLAAANPVVRAHLCLLTRARSSHTRTK